MRLALGCAVAAGATGPAAPARAGDPAFDSARLARDPTASATASAWSATDHENPANAGRTAGLGMAASHLQWTGELSLETLRIEIGFPRGTGASVEASLLRTGAALPGWSEDGTSLPSFSPREASIGLEASTPVGASVRVGVGITGRQVDDGASSVRVLSPAIGLAAALGPTSIGISLLDVTTLARSEPVSGDIDAPRLLRVGASQEVTPWARGACTLEHSDAGVTARVGLSVRAAVWGEILFGTTLSDRPPGDDAFAPSCGLRVRASGVTFGYAVQSPPGLELSHHVGIELMR